MIVKYTNNSADKILKLIVNEHAKEFEELIIVNSKQKLVQNLIFQEDQEDSVYLGSTKINEKLYDWSYQTIDWEDEKCFMIKAQDITTISDLERLKTENRSTNLLLRSVSHELRTPVNGALLIIEEIITEIPVKLQEKFDYIKTCIELLKFQISDILDFSEIHHNKFVLNKVPYDLRKCIFDGVNLFKHQAKYKKLDLICKIDPYIPKICFFDKQRLQKVIVNLLSNSIKFTNHGSIEVSAFFPRDSIKIVVKDTGIGIPKERLDQLFLLFNDNSESGLSGLGLHITYKILNYFGSSLNVVSEHGKGSIFSFELNSIFLKPLKNFENSEEIEIPDEGKHILLPKNDFCVHDQIQVKVLIVDDNEFNRMCLGNVLKSLNVSYVEAINGKDAVEQVIKYDRMKKPIKLIFMDCNMPIMDGWEASENINRKFSEGILRFLPVILGYTAYSSFEDIKKCYDSGMSSYILKPATRVSLISIVQQYEL